MLERKLGLWNFNREHEADRVLYECVRNTFSAMVTGMENAKRVLQDITDNPENGDEEKASLGKECLKEMVDNYELTLLLKALDFKMSVLLRHMAEPRPGYFAQVGVGRDHPQLPPLPCKGGNRRVPHLWIVK